MRKQKKKKREEMGIDSSPVYEVVCSVSPWYRLWLLQL